MEEMVMTQLKVVLEMTRYMEEMAMTEYLVVQIIPMTIKMQVEMMKFMEEMVMM
jgi:hypothetical protein